MAKQHVGTGGQAHGKDVSVGEYEPATGLTHVTRQRGRLLFNMGTSTVKRQRQRQRQRRAPPAASRSDSPAPATSSPAPRPVEQEAVLMRTGRFTGLSLYPEEAYYLLQRGALAVYLMLPLHRAKEPATLSPLSIAAFASMLATHTHASLACLEVYSFLKDQKLHPRRCLELIEPGTERYRRREPQHFAGGDICHVAFDVWKTVVTRMEEPMASQSKPKARKSKRLALAFRVIVSRYGDVPPRPRVLRQAIERSEARASDAEDTAVVGVKLAVVHHDRSVLLFELGSVATSM